MISICDLKIKKRLVPNPGIHILNLIPIRRQEHILGAFMTHLLLMKTKLKQDSAGVISRHENKSISRRNL